MRTREVFVTTVIYIIYVNNIFTLLSIYNITATNISRVKYQWKYYHFVFVPTKPEHY